MREPGRQNSGWKALNLDRPRRHGPPRPSPEMEEVSSGPAPPPSPESLCQGGARETDGATVCNSECSPRFNRCSAALLLRPRVGAASLSSDPSRRSGLHPYYDSGGNHSPGTGLSRLSLLFVGAVRTRAQLPPPSAVRGERLCSCFVRIHTSVKLMASSSFFNVWMGPVGIGCRRWVTARRLETISPSNSPSRLSPLKL